MESDPVGVELRCIVTSTNGSRHVLLTPGVATKAPATECDSRLAAFFRSDNDVEEQEALASLMAVHAQPLIEKILHGKLGPSSRDEEIEDLASQVVVLLLSRLHDLKKEATSEPVRDLSDYVATTTYYVYHDHLRKKHPERHRLKTRLRYLLTREPRFALWEERERVWVCGWAAWRHARLPTWARLVSVNASIHLRSWDRRELVEILTSVFDVAGQPVHFNTLISLLAERSPCVSAIGGGRELETATATMPGNAADQADDRIFLKQLWMEIGKLPLNMRTVLLLNLRGPEGRNVIDLLPATGIASVRDMANALEMPVEQLAALWIDLPLDDQALAARLNATRQQVINLRASARRRLTRQMDYQV